jgi:hypothetical protein
LECVATKVIFFLIFQKKYRKNYTAKTHNTLFYRLLNNFQEYRYGHIFKKGQPLTADTANLQDIITEVTYNRLQEFFIKFTA